MYRDQAIAELIALGRDFAARDWLPGGSGNFSARLEDGRILLTASGHHKGRLEPQHFLCLGRDDDPATHQPAPSAEALLHLHRYRADEAVGCVLHTHSVAATVLSRRGGAELRLAGYELAKAFAGISTHDTVLAVPIVENDQDMTRIVAALDGRDIGRGGAPLYLIRGHGLYTWAETIERARNQIEAAEFLLRCHLHERELK